MKTIKFRYSVDRVPVWCQWSVGVVLIEYQRIHTLSISYRYSIGNILTFYPLYLWSVDNFFHFLFENFFCSSFCRTWDLSNDMAIISNDTFGSLSTSYQQPTVSHQNFTDILHTSSNRSPKLGEVGKNIASSRHPRTKLLIFSIST